MGVEIHDVPKDLRPQLENRVQSYRGELKRLNKEFVSICVHVLQWTLTNPKSMGHASSTSVEFSD